MTYQESTFILDNNPPSSQMLAPLSLPETRYLGSVMECLHLTTRDAPILQQTSEDVRGYLLQGFKEAIPMLESIGVDPVIIAKAKKIEKNLAKMDPGTELQDATRDHITDILKDLQRDADVKLYGFQEDMTRQSPAPRTAVNAEA
jgi:hypothetical protein